MCQKLEFDVWILNVRVVADFCGFVVVSRECGLDDLMSQSPDSRVGRCKKKKKHLKTHPETKTRWSQLDAARTFCFFNFANCAHMFGTR